MSGHDTLDLYDDGFEGSNDELLIAQEVFYGNVADLCSKRFTDNGVTNTASEENKTLEISLCSNSENSVVTTNQASSKDICHKDDEMIDFQRDLGAQNSLEWSILGARIEHDLQAKRMKLSVNELSNFKPYLDTAVSSSMPVKQVVSGMYDSSVHPCQILMCHVVESSSQGVTSSCYLLKQYPESHQEGNLRDKSTPNVSLSGSDVTMVKNFGGSKSIASPISQESSATKVLVNRSRLFKRVEKRPKRDISPEPEDDDVLLTSDSMKDSRALLRSRVFHLLKRAGWSTEKRDRGCGKYRYVYRSPQGKLFREFRRVWNFLGQSEFRHCRSQVAGDDKHWTDVGHFWSDLYDTLRRIENEMDDWGSDHALAHQWSLLNPFVTVVLIDRKIHALRAGNLNKAKESNVVDDGGQSKQEASEAYKSRSIYVSEGNSMRLVKTIDRIENHSVGTCSGEIMHNSSQLSCSVSESTSLCGVPVGNANINTVEGLSEAFSPNHDSCMSSPMLNKQNLKPSKENVEDIAVCPLERGVERFGRVSRKKSKACQLKDDDLLISAIIKKRSFKSNKNKCSEESGKFKSKPPKKRKTQKGRCRLLPRSLGKGSKHFIERWSLVGERTVLSWLISAGAVFINEAIQYRDPKDDSVVKDGQITRPGILCKCCNDVFSVSGFKIHAGFKQGRPCLNLFMGSGRPYTLCQLQAWSAEYKARRSCTRSMPADEFDENDDSCGICGDGGELLCCDNCPSTFHQSCLSAQELPEGSWYCSNCTCGLCGDLVNDKETLCSDVGLKCSHCEQKYHQVCLIDKTMARVGDSSWFCSIGCEEVYGGLQSRVGLCNPIADSYSWTLLKCIHDDQKIPSPQHFALKAECNSKLAVAITIMEECFLSMTDPRTGIDMIPQVVYNWGSDFARLDYHGFYTAVLEMDDVLICVASIRLHGVAVAEMPLIATCSKYRRQGMCRRLLDAVEKMLLSLKVEKLVVAAIPELVETWTVGFGFVPMEDNEKKGLRKINLMVFPGTVMLKKTLYVNQPAALTQQGVKEVSPLKTDEAFEIEVFLEGEPNTEASSDLKSSEVVAPINSGLLNTSVSFECKDNDTNITALEPETELDDGVGIQVIQDQDDNVPKDPESVEASEQPESVPTLQDNPDGKSEIILRDNKTVSTDQEDYPLSTRFSDEVVSSQVESGIAEVAGCKEKGPESDQQVELQGSLDVVFKLEKCPTDQCCELSSAREGLCVAKIHCVHGNENQLSLIERSEEASVFSQSL